MSHQPPSYTVHNSIVSFRVDNDQLLQGELSTTRLETELFKEEFRYCLKNI